MRSISYLVLLIASGLILAGCAQNINYTQVTIDGNLYKLKTARAEQERAKGLSGRQSLDKNSGMIFYFDKPDYLSFWMKDTLIPLQIIFINSCEIVDIQEMAVEENLEDPQQTYESKMPADKAIELNSKSVPQNTVGTKIKDLCRV